MLGNVRQPMNRFAETVLSATTTPPSNTYQTVCGQPVPLRPHANDQRNGLVLHAQDVQAVLRTLPITGLTRMDQRPVANIVDQQTGVVFRDEYEVDLSQNYGVLMNPSPQASPIASPNSSPRAVRKAPSRATPRSADQNQTDCVVCHQDLGHKAGRYSMNCRCTVKPCHHRMVCNACGVFFADETVKRREDPSRKQPGEHMHTEKFKVHCQACSYERYERCLAAHMLPSRVGNRKKRSPKVKRPGRKPAASERKASVVRRNTKAARDDDMIALEDATHRTALILDRLALESEADSACESNPSSPPESDLDRSLDHRHDLASDSSMFAGLNLLSLAAAELERCPAASG